MAITMTDSTLVSQPATELSKLSRHFEIHNLTEGKSQRTAAWYKEVLDLFERWLGSEGFPATVSELNENNVRGFILHVQSLPGRKGEKVSTHTVSNRVRALRAVLRWAWSKGYLDRNIAADIRVPKVSQPLIAPLSEHEIQALFSALDSDTPLGSRNTAILALFLDAGLRLSELCGLKDDDVDIERRWVTVWGKGDKERLVNFGHHCQRALIDYVFKFKPEPAIPVATPFFRSIDGYALETQAITSWLRRIGPRAGVERVHPHLLRHTYASNFLVAGGSLDVLQDNLGHSEIETTLKYVHISKVAQAARSEGFSALDRMALAKPKRNRR